jgi:hypothetical protein
MRAIASHASDRHPAGGSLVAASIYSTAAAKSKPQMAPPGLRLNRAYALLQSGGGITRQEESMRARPDMIRPASIAAAAAVALVCALGTAASVQIKDKTFELKLSHWVPPSHPLQKALEDWGASVEKASNGTLKY